LQVFDKFDAKRTVFVPVLVFEGAEVTPQSAQEYFISAVVNASGFADELKQAAALTSSIINAVNCTAAPNCTQLNRKQCSVYQSTCGECLEGYLGESGHKNSLCVGRIDDSDVTSRQLTVWNHMFSGGTECSLNEHCNSALWEVCVDGVCRIAPQRCTNECSGHGSCSFLSTLNSSHVVETCSVLDFNCRAVCVCESGFNGSSCEYTSYDFELLQSIRHDIAVAIRNISLIEDPTPESVVSWLNGLSTVAADSNSLKEETKALLASMAIEFINKASYLGLQFEETTSTASILDLVLSTSNDVAFELLQVYGEYISADMTDGQNPIEVINQAFRLVSVSLDGLSNSSVSSPMSSIEKALNTSAHVAHIPTTSTDESLKVVVIEGPGLSNGTYLSMPFGLNFDKSPCADNSDSSCDITVVLQYEFPVNTGEQFHDPITVDFECKRGLEAEHNYTCPLSEVLSVSCNGSVAGVWSKACPVYQPGVICESIGTSTSSCDIVQYTSNNVTCQCSLPSNSNQRRLQESGDNDDAENNAAISLNFVAASESVLVEFVSTWKSASDLSTSDTKNNWRVLVTIGSIGVCGVFFMVWGWWTDTTSADEEKRAEEQRKKDEKAEKGVENSIKKRLNRQNVSWERVLRPQKSISPVKPQSIKAMSARDRTKSFVTLPEEKTVEAALPAVLKPFPLWKKYIVEARVYHRWAGVILHTSSRFPRPLRVLSLMMNILIMLFIEAMTYNIADPNDGSCETYNTESECLTEMSSLADHEPKCYWDNDNSSCHFREIDGEFYRVVTVAVIAAVVGTPCALAIEALISNVLAARTIDESEIKKSLQRQLNCNKSPIVRPTKVANEHPSAAKKSVQLLQIIEEAYGCTIDEDYQSLRNELQNHRQSLSPGERNEFDKIWGLDLSDIDYGASYKCWKILSRRIFPHSNIDDSESLLLAELQSVRDCFAKECEFFDNAALSDEEKNSRLLFLFIKDLMDGVNGQIMDAKDRRDHEIRKAVTLTTKLYAWTAIGLMASGMLFYLFLFAIRQTEQRQAAWLQSFIVWLFFEILIVSSFLVLVQHIVIPSLVMEDVRKVKKRVVNDIISFKSNAKNRAYSVLPRRRNTASTRRESATSVQKLNAAKYLYVSWRIAKFYPNLPQSSMVTRFSTPWPKRAITRKFKGVSKAYSKKFSFVNQAVSRVVLYLLVSVVQLPPAAQDTVVQVILSSGIGYVIMLLVQLYEVHPILVLVPVVTVFIVAHFLFSSNKHSDLSLLNSASSMSLNSRRTSVKENDIRDTKDLSVGAHSVFPIMQVSGPESHMETLKVCSVETDGTASTVLRDMRNSLSDILPVSSALCKSASPISKSCPLGSSKPCRRACADYDEGEEADNEEGWGDVSDDSWGDMKEVRRPTRTHSIHSQIDELEDLQVMLNEHFGCFLNDKTEAGIVSVGVDKFLVEEEDVPNAGEASVDEIFQILAETFSLDYSVLSPSSKSPVKSSHDDSSPSDRSCASPEVHTEVLEDIGAVQFRDDESTLSRTPDNSVSLFHRNVVQGNALKHMDGVKSLELIAIEEARRHISELENQYAILEAKYRKELACKVSSNEAQSLVGSILASTVPAIAKSQVLKEIRDSLSVGLANGIIAIAAAHVATEEGSVRKTKEEREQAELEILRRSTRGKCVHDCVDAWIERGKAKHVLRALCAEKSEKFVKALVVKEVLKLSGVDEPFKRFVPRATDDENIYNDTSGWRSRYEALSGMAVKEYEQTQRIIKQLQHRCLTLERQFYEGRNEGRNESDTASLPQSIGGDIENFLERDISSYFFSSDDFSFGEHPVEQFDESCGDVHTETPIGEDSDVVKHSKASMPENVLDIDSLEDIMPEVIQLLNQVTAKSEQKEND